MLQNPCQARLRFPFVLYYKEDRVGVPVRTH